MGPKLAPSTRFSLDVWAEHVQGGQVEWRGKVHHLGTGNARYFRDWPTMVGFVEAQAAATETNEGALQRPASVEPASDE